MEPSNYRESVHPIAAQALSNNPTSIDLDDASELAEAIVDTIRDPLFVLDRELRIVTANRAFYQTFRMNRQDIHRRPIFGIDGGRWDIPALRLLLADVGGRHAVTETYEFEYDLPVIGRRAMQLSAREVFSRRKERRLVLVTIEDITDRQVAERAVTGLLQQKEILLQEMRHRVANGLQIVASILMLKARTVQSDETRRHLCEARDRILSMAAVQRQLQASGRCEPIELGPFLCRLCDALAASMIGDDGLVTLGIEADAGAVASGDAVGIGLIIAELVINALKHAFPSGSAGRILVRYAADGSSWRLSVADNGVGLRQGPHGRIPTGLGTTIVDALAQQLKARVETVGGSPGLTVSIVHA